MNQPRLGFNKLFNLFVISISMAASICERLQASQHRRMEKVYQGGGSDVRHGKKGLVKSVIKHICI